MYDHTANIVYIQNDRHWIEYKTKPKRFSRAQANYQKTGRTNNPPQGCQRGTFHYLSSDVITFEGSAPIHHSSCTVYSSLNDIFTQWGETWVWKHFSIEDNGEWLADASRGGTSILVVM